MQLEKSAIDEFKKLYFDAFDETITDEEAEEYGFKLIQLVKAVYGHFQPIKIDKN